MLQMLRRNDNAAHRRFSLPGDPPLAQLSGAVAHDLNNLWTVIRGNCELMKDVMGQPDLTHDLIGEIVQASIVEESRGSIAVVSHPGQGTVFTIELPRAAENAAGQPLPLEEPLTAGATILLVEDESLVRSVFRRILQSSGYFVMEASNGREALTLAEHFSLPIHLLVTDLNMPHLGGMEVARRMVELHPESKVLLVSGFSDETTTETVDTRYPLLLKPFTAETLLERVRTILGQG